MLIQNHIVDLETPTGTMRTYVHRPAGDGRYPAILFYSEIFQQTGPIERAARIMAGHGYAVLVPEVFHELNPIGTVLGYDDAGRDKGNADKSAKPAESYDSDNRVLIDWVKQQPWCTGEAGAMGFCIGGHLAFRAALQPEIKATACFYATDLHTRTIPNQPGQHSMERRGEITKQSNKPPMICKGNKYFNDKNALTAIKTINRNLNTILFLLNIPCLFPGRTNSEFLLSCKWSIQ